jgi:hypothetical protein
LALRALEARFFPCGGGFGFAKAENNPFHVAFMSQVHENLLQLNPIYKGSRKLTADMR